MLFTIYIIILNTNYYYINFFNSPNFQFVNKSKIY